MDREEKEANKDKRERKETKASWYCMEPTVSKGETGLKGQKGDTGTAGMKGAKGEPGESIAAPTVAVSPAKMTVNESKTASFQCSVSGNPKPVATLE